MARLVDEQGALVPAPNFMPMALERLKKDIQAEETVAINLSPQSMVSGEFMDWFVARLDSLGGGALRLAIEVSKFAALRHTAKYCRIT